MSDLPEMSAKTTVVDHEGVMAGGPRTLLLAGRGDEYVRDRPKKRFTIGG